MHLSEYKFVSGNGKSPYEPSQAFPLFGLHLLAVEHMLADSHKVVNLPAGQGTFVAPTVLVACVPLRFYEVLLQECSYKVPFTKTVYYLSLPPNHSNLYSYQDCKYSLVAEYILP